MAAYVRNKIKGIEKIMVTFLKIVWMLSFIPITCITIQAFSTIQNKDHIVTESIKIIFLVIILKDLTYCVCMFCYGIYLGITGE